MRRILALSPQVFLLMIIAVWSCKKDDEPKPPPMITSFSPESGAVGTTVTITGEHFSAAPEDNTVTFNLATADVSAATTTSLTVTVPAGATTGKITVATSHGAGTSATDFTVITEPGAPTITSFTPASGIAGSFVDITGTNFSTTAADNIVTFNTVSLPAIASTATTLRAVVPVGAITGKLKVTVDGVTATSATDFVVPLPTISGFSPMTGMRGSTVVITGANFSGASGNLVQVNGVDADITAVNTAGTQLTITVPPSATTGKISVNVGGQVVTSDDDFIVLLPNSWAPIATFDGVGRDNIGFAFVINGKAYVGAAGQDDSNNNLKDFWEYDPQADTWTRKADFEGTERNGATGFAIGSKGYVGTGFSSGTSLKDFWEYDPATNDWTQKADFEGDARSGAAGFGIGDRGYIGAGVTSGGTYAVDFWEYNPASDEWTQKADYSGGGRAYMANFAVNGKGYIGLGQGSGAGRDFWEYDPVADEWTEKLSYPAEAAQSMVTFSLGTKAYVAGTELWMFDPVENTWTKKADPEESVYSGVAFSIGNFGYLGLGSGVAPKSKKFFLYIPD